MTKEEKLMRLLEMQEHPERYTDEEIRQLMADEEVRQLYEQMVRATDALYGEKIEEKSEFTIRYYLKKIAAVFIGLLILSGITYAAIHLSRSGRGDSTSAPQDTTTVANIPQPNVNAPLAEQDSMLLKPVVFEDAELVTILNEVAAFYQYEVIYKQEAVKHVRLYFTWNKKEKIEDVVETFNKFERIHITMDDRKLIVR